MKKQIYKPFLTALMAALMSLPGIMALPVQAQTENETVETVSGGDVGKAGAHTLVETDTYTDSNGNSYKWYGYNDQTAEIYEIVPFADRYHHCL